MLVDGSPVTEKVDKGEQNVVGMLGRSTELVAGRRTVSAVSRCSLARCMNNLQRKSLYPMPVFSDLQNSIAFLRLPVGRVRVG
jgi:hypothetical protein